MEENEKNIPAAPVSGVENDVTKAAPTTEAPAAAPAQAAAPRANRPKHPLALLRVPRHPNLLPNLLSTRLSPKS